MSSVYLLNRPLSPRHPELHTGSVYVLRVLHSLCITPEHTTLSVWSVRLTHYSLLHIPGRSPSRLLFKSPRVPEVPAGLDQPLNYRLFLPSLWEWVRPQKWVTHSDITDLHSSKPAQLFQDSEEDFGLMRRKSLTACFSTAPCGWECMLHQTRHLKRKNKVLMNKVYSDLLLC